MKLPADLHPDLLARFADAGGPLSRRMGVEFHGGFEKARSASR